MELQLQCALIIFRYLPDGQIHTGRLRTFITVKQFSKPFFAHKTTTSLLLEGTLHIVIVFVKKPSPDKIGNLKTR